MLGLAERGKWIRNISKQPSKSQMGVDCYKFTRKAVGDLSNPLNPSLVVNPTYATQDSPCIWSVTQSWD